MEVMVCRYASVIPEDSANSQTYLQDSCAREYNPPLKLNCSYLSESLHEVDPATTCNGVLCDSTATEQNLPIKCNAATGTGRQSERHTTHTPPLETEKQWHVSCVTENHFFL